jgi:rod shape-determining protein MreB
MRFRENFSIDLGTTNTVICTRKKGVVLSEPSVIAITKDNTLVEAGIRAKKMLGKTPQSIKVIRPLKDGVISDYDATTMMVEYFLKKVMRDNPSLIKPKVVAGIPIGATEVEKKALFNALKESGAGEVFLIPEPMAVALSLDFETKESFGFMVVDIGGGTTEIAIMSLGSIVISKSLDVAGDEMDEAIVNYVKEQYSLSIGLETAERIKLSLSSANTGTVNVEKVVGIDITTGLPKEQDISLNDVLEAINPIIKSIVSNVRFLIEQTPPELISEIYRNGIILSGGGSMLKEIDRKLNQEIGIKILKVSEPLNAVAIGALKVFDDIELQRELRVVET